MRILKEILSIIVLLFIAHSAFAQSSSTGFGTENLMKEEILQSTAKGQLQASVPKGDIIIPEEYYVGPGDILAVQILNYSPAPLLLAVTQECKLLIPRMGEVPARNMTLSDIKIKIEQLAKERNIGTAVYVSVYEPRNVFLTVNGATDLKGTFNVPASCRASTALKYIKQVYDMKKRESQASISRDEMGTKLNYETIKANQVEEFTENLFSKRNIVLQRGKSTSLSLDFLKDEFSEGDKNPFIRENDIIFVPAEADNYSKISVRGAVTRPGEFPYKKSDKASDLLKFGGAFFDNADLENVMLYFPNSDVPTRLVVDSSMKILSGDVALFPGCRILVGQKNESTNEINGSVTVAGYVVKPGTYYIKQNETKLKTIIELAGGFTKDAYLPLAYIRRKTIDRTGSDYRSFNIYDKFRNSNLTLQDTFRFRVDEQFKNFHVSCDLDALYNKNSEIDNVTLIDGDFINVPDKPRSVYVYGQVNKPGFVSFVEGQTMEYYIEKAGGFSDNAQKRRSRIIRGVSRVWVEGDSKTLVFAGDEVYVPRPEDLPPGSEMQTYAVVASVLVSLVSVVNFIVYMFTK